MKNKCRACWIAACSRVYSVDPKRDAVLSANFPYQNETNQLHHGDDDDETKQEDAKSSDSDVVTETTTITTVTNSNEESVTRSASPLSLESQNDLMSSAIILQQFLEQSNRLKHCLQTSSGTADRHSVIGQTNSSPEIYTSSEMIDSSHCDVGDANQKPSNETGNCDSIMNSDQDPANMLYSPSSRLSGVSAVAAAAVAVEKATIRQQEQQHQQRLNEALCAEMLMKLESVAAQQQQSSVGSGDIEPGLRNAGDYADSRPESECENHSALSMMDTYNGNVGNLTEHHSRHPHHHQINANDQIETLENSMFVNLLPDLEGIGIGSNGPQCKTDACCTSELLNDAKSLKSLIKRRRKSKSAVSSPTVESDFVSGIKKSKARVKNWCCLKCSNCLADDCGKCINCLDRPKFGGPFIRKQRCINKRCLMKGSKLERNNIVSNGSNTIIISNGAIASCETSSLNQPLFDRSMNSVPTIDD